VLIDVLIRSFFKHNGFTR